MNKFLKFLALVLVMGALLSFAACTPNDGTTTTAPNTTTTAPTTGADGGSTTAPTTAPTQAPAPAYTYRVRVVDEEGNPVAGVTVQLCLTTCTPKKTNDEGWAEFTNAVQDGYHANITKAPSGFEIPEGKTIDQTEYTFASGETETTLVLKLIDKAE